MYACIAGEIAWLAHQPARILHMSRPVYCISAGPYTAHQPARILHISRPVYCISAGPYIAYQPVRILHISRPVFCISEAEQGGDFEGLLSHIFYHAQAEPGDASPARPAVVRWEDCEVKPCDKGWGRRVPRELTVLMVAQLNRRMVLIAMRGPQLKAWNPRQTPATEPQSLESSPNTSD